MTRVFSDEVRAFLKKDYELTSDVYDKVIPFENLTQEQVEFYAKSVEARDAWFALLVKSIKVGATLPDPTALVPNALLGHPLLKDRPIKPTADPI